MKDIIKELINTYSIVLCGFLAAGLINLYIINF